MTHLSPKQSTQMGEFTCLGNMISAFACRGHRAESDPQGAKGPSSARCKPQGEQPRLADLRPLLLLVGVQDTNHDVAAIQAGTRSLRCWEARLESWIWRKESDSCGPGAGAEGCRCDTAFAEPEMINLSPWQSRTRRVLSHHISSVLSLLHSLEIAMELIYEHCKLHDTNFVQP